MHAENMTAQEAFVKKIERFCRCTGMAESTFGYEAVNDRSFVFDLRRGRNIQLRTVERVEKFMAERRKRCAA